MKDAKTTKFLGFVVILAVIVAGYFLVISPFLAQRTLAVTSIESAKVNNANLTTKIAELTTIKELAPAAKTYDDELTAMFPATAAAGELRSQISGIASANGVTATVGTTVPVFVVAPSTVAVSAAADTATTDAAAPADAAPAAPAAATVSSDLASIDVTISVTGPRDGIVSFLTDLNKIDRGLFFSGITIAGDVGGEAGDNYTLDIPAVTYLYRAIPYPIEEAAAADGTATSSDVSPTGAATEGQ